MEPLKLSVINKAISGQMTGEDCLVKTISIDSRTLLPGSLFIALKGKNFNGHDFVKVAEENGAVAILAEENVKANIPIIYVENTENALGQLAAFVRQQFNAPILAITGTCGKTTTRAMLASILEQKNSVLYSQSSFNNAIGLPLTLLQQQKKHQFAVLEMGTNHFGELDYLTKIAKPDVAVVLNVGAGHLEGFGNIEGVSRAKGEIFSGLSQTGTAVINIDDQFANYFRSLLQPKQKMVTFGLTDSADVWASNIVVDVANKLSFDLHIEKKNIRVQLSTIGKHNVPNALAAASMAHAVGIDIEVIQKGLAEMQPVTKRMNLKKSKQGADIIDDTYNAIPNAVHAALEVLANMPGEKIFVFGGMGELGQHVEIEHRLVGEKAQALGINRLYAVGPFSHLTINAFGSHGKLFSSK
ncbi:MAG: UDP-N-acetylmuramoyl-tripeptide--D-alanyl-D-alanine ligase [Gammaproteobacteria bacterium]